MICSSEVVLAGPILGKEVEPAFQVGGVPLRSALDQQVERPKAGSVWIVFLFVRPKAAEAQVKDLRVLRTSDFQNILGAQPQRQHVAHVDAPLKLVPGLAQPQAVRQHFQKADVPWLVLGEREAVAQLLLALQKGTALEVTPSAALSTSNQSPTVRLLPLMHGAQPTCLSGLDFSSMHMIALPHAIIQQHL